MRFLPRRAKEFSKTCVRGMMHLVGCDICYYPYPPDFSEYERNLCQKVGMFVQGSPENVVNTMHAVEHVVRSGVHGSIVECGVWKGGSAMAAILTLERLGCHDRHLYLYDTFEGMTRPTEYDVDYDGVLAIDQFRKLQTGPDSSSWNAISLDEARRNVLSVRSCIPEENIHFIKGKVEDTIPGTAPGSISVLRLDTDWYESTRHELVHLYPLLRSGGVLIIDDYGHFKGSRRATDEYLATLEASPALFRIDRTCRVCIKK